MSYPGNPSLSTAVKERVLSTFRQTVVLYQQGGRTEEVTSGCNLLLQMDPTFDPAKKLLEKLRNPASPIDVSTLLPPESQIRSPMQLAREAMAERDFQRVVQLTSDILTEDLLNDEARILGDDAREKLEAAPFVEQFARKADMSLASGNVASAKMELEKARALDPAHPDVQRVSKAIQARGASPSAALPPSFIVDDSRAQPASGRSAAQAADFGFTFEEEKPTDVPFDQFSFDTASAPADFSFQAPPPPPKNDTPFGGFSFDSAAAAPAAAAESPYAPGGDFDFSNASVQTSGDDQKKIDQFLADGERAFRAGDYSQAIDLWSRIFLIDVTNDAASERIEAAKTKRREIEQQVEPMLTAAVDAFERGDAATARTGLSEVLAADPRNSVAQDYLNRLGAAKETAASSPSRPYIAPSASTTESLSIFDEELPPGLEMPLIPPDPSSRGGAVAAKAEKKKKTEKKRPSRPLPVRLIATVFGALLLVTGGWFAWTRLRDQPESVVVTAGEGDALINRAGILAGQGKFDQAIALLQDIKPGDPQHEKALLMIADLRGRKSTSAQLIDGVPAEEYFAQRIEAARTAFDANDFINAKTAFEQAMRVKPLPAELKTQYEEAGKQASKLDAAKALFSERKFAEAIANLEPLQAQEPENASIRRMIADAHFNLAATALQEERVPDAIRELDEVLKVHPDDELAGRTRELAQRYNGEAKDLLYKIYVKYLPLRQGT